MTDKKKPEELSEDDLSNVEGGVGLLLPAVQKAREAARKTTDTKTETFARSDTKSFASNAGGSPNV